MRRARYQKTILTMSTTTTKKNIPELRFPGFFGEWQEMVVGNFLNERKEYSIKGKGLKHVSLTTKGVVSKSRRYDRDFLVRNDEEKSYKVTRMNDLCYNPANLKFGVISINKLGDGIFSPIYITYEIEKQDIDFIGYLLTQNKFINKARKFEQGTVYERMAVHPNDFENVQVFLPKIKEQEKIAIFLGSADSLLENLRKEKQKLEEYKRGMMQKIFSQEVRFKNENGKDFPKWKEVPLKEVLKKRSVRNNNSEYKNVLTNSAQYGIVNQSEYFSKDIANQDNLTNYYVVETDDFIYNPRISKFAPVGPFKRNKNGRGIMSPLYTILKLSKGNLSFYEYYFDTNLWHRYMFKISNFGARHDRMNIRGEDFMKMPIPFPDTKEQEKIASFLIAIDKLISMKAEQVKNAETWKKGLLQKMFV